jgi:hypothetical protein
MFWTGSAGQIWAACRTSKPKFLAFLCMTSQDTLSIPAEPFHVLHMDPMSDDSMCSQLLVAHLCHTMPCFELDLGKIWAVPSIPCKKLCHNQPRHHISCCWTIPRPPYGSSEWWFNVQPAPGGPSVSYHMPCFELELGKIWAAHPQHLCWASLITQKLRPRTAWTPCERGAYVNAPFSQFLSLGAYVNTASWSLQDSVRDQKSIYKSSKCVEWSLSGCVNVEHPIYNYIERLLQVLLK